MIGIHLSMQLFMLSFLKISNVGAVPTKPIGFVLKLVGICNVCKSCIVLFFVDFCGIAAV